MFLSKTNKYAISSIIKSLKNKAMGYDNINTKVVKTSIDVISNPLSHIINLCFSQGVVPEELKISLIVPIYKSGNNHHPTNYRPISLLPVLSKIFERSLYNRIINFLNKKMLFLLNNLVF